MAIIDWYNGLKTWQKITLFFLIALIVRVIGINYGYWHGDERIGAAAKVLTGKLVPNLHFYPPFMHYVNATFFAMMYAVGRLVPFWYDASGFREQYFSDPTAFYLMARFVTAAISAAAVPIFYLVGKSLKFDNRSCVLMALFGIFIPVMVLLSHISKSDIGLATATILVFYVVLLKHEYLEQKRYDFLIGISVALAMSFKHSYIFIMLPLALGHIVLLWRLVGPTKTFQSLVWASLVLVPAWCVMNIGILLDFKNFLDFQKIQAQMSVREGETFAQAIGAWFYWASHNVSGVNVIVTLLFFAFPVYLYTSFSRLPNKALLLVMWLSILLPMILVIKISGVRQHAGLWVPYFTAMQFFVAVILVDGIRNAGKQFRLGAIGLASLTLIFSMYGTMLVWKQALAKPIAVDIAEDLQTFYPDRKLLTTYKLRIEQALEAQEIEMERHERLAEKYGVTLPPQAEERRTQKSPDAMYYFHMPDVMFGLEDTDDESLGDSMKAYTWPLQKDEWTLKHWTDRGVSIIILSDHQYFLTKSKIKAYRNFHIEISETCEKVAHYAARKPDLIEFPLTVYDCPISS